jgi:hypothetical protein
MLLSEAQAGGEVHIQINRRHCCVSSLFIPSPLVRSPLSLLFPFPSHFSVLTIQFMTMNAGELLANSLSAGKPLAS